MPRSSFFPHTISAKSLLYRENKRIIRLDSQGWSWDGCFLWYVLFRMMQSATDSWQVAPAYEWFHWDCTKSRLSLPMLPYLKTMTDDKDNRKGEMASSVAISGKTTYRPCHFNEDEILNRFKVISHDIGDKVISLSEDLSTVQIASRAQVIARPSMTSPTRRLISNV